IDQDAIRCADICSYFHGIGHSAYSAADYPGALRVISEHACDVVFTSVSIIGGTVHDLILAVKGKDPKAEIIVDADVQTTQEAVQAVREGAFSILQRPFSIPELNFQI